MEKNYFKQDAKTIVDMLFEAKLFKDHITRDDMNVTEALIESMMTMRLNGHLKLDELTRKIKTNK